MTVTRLEPTTAYFAFENEHSTIWANCPTVAHKSPQSNKNCCWRTCVIRKCSYSYLLSTGRWSRHDWCSYNYYQQTNYSQQINEQTKVILELVLTEVSKLNHAVMNKKQGDQMQFSLEKRLVIEKRKWIHHICAHSLSTHHTSRWNVL